MVLYGHTWGFMAQMITMRGDMWDELVDIQQYWRILWCCFRVLYGFQVNVWVGHF